MTFETWFASRGWSPFAFQRDVWAAYRAGESGLIHAATGTGKTLAAWGGPVSEWLDEQTLMPAPRVGKPRRGTSPPLRVLWITPLRALAADTEEALRQPLVDLGIPWSLESRTGDTSYSILSVQHRSLSKAMFSSPK